MSKYWDIFIRFCRVGALTFGGGLSMLPILERELGDRESPYLTKSDIIDNYALSQCTPGIISVNTSILCGYQIGGTIGGIVAGIGVSFPSIIIILIVASIMGNLTANPYISIALMGVRSGVCALILQTVRNLIFKSLVDYITLALFFFTIAILTFVNISPVIPVIIGGTVGFFAKKAGEKS